LAVPMRSVRPVHDSVQASLLAREEAMGQDDASAPRGVSFNPNCWS